MYNSLSVQIILKNQREIEDLRTIYAVAQDQEDSEVLGLVKERAEQLLKRVKMLESIASTEIICRCDKCVYPERFTKGATK